MLQKNYISIGEGKSFLYIHNLGRDMIYSNSKIYKNKADSPKRVSKETMRKMNV